MNRRRRAAFLTRISIAVVALAIPLAVSAAATAEPQAGKARPCTGVAKGAAWSYKGQKGTAYTVLGVNGVSCAIGLAHMSKWTHDRATFDLEPVPAGWHCSAIGDYTALAKLGQCTTKQGGIFEWLPKRKP